MIKKSKIKINGVDYNLTTYIEHRNSVRASITKSGINLRIPSHLNSIEKKIEARKFLNWAIEKIKSKPETIPRAPIYQNNDIIKTNSKIYKLEIEYRNSQKNFSKISGSYITMKISNRHDEKTRQKYISKQLRKLLAKNHTQELYKKVHHLNSLYINRPINKISYKYTLSRWGACNKTKKEISLSTRLLLAPEEVLDYVIIHELAHLIEPNHSKRFWNIVKSIDPNFKQKKKWLNDHGNKLNI